MKYLIFDAGPIISMTMNGLLPVVEKMKERFPGIEFILTPDVKKEVVDRPMKIKKFKLEALQVQKLIEKGVFKMSGNVISDSKLRKEMKKIEKTANGVLRATNTKEKIRIIHDGEVACLAFCNLVKGEHLIVIDERTTRMLIEAPERLEEMMERKLHTPLDSTPDLIKNWKNFKFIRSAEFLYIAWKMGLIGGEGNLEMLDALLYGVKFKGCAITSTEIEELKKIAGHWS